MLRLLILTIAYLLVPVHTVQAQEDIVMKIGGHPVYKSEFVNEYKKSYSTSVKEFLPQFVSRKMRIIDLQDRGVDTLTSFKILLAKYQGERLRSELVGRYKQSIAASAANNRFNNSSWIKYQLIEKYVPQNSSKAFIEKIKMSSDSIYNALRNGEDIDALSIKFSDNKSDVQPHWCRTCLLPAEIISILDKAKKGDILHPVFTPSGYSIVKIVDMCDSVPEEIIDRQIDSKLVKADTKMLSFSDLSGDIRQELLYKIAIDNDSISTEVSESEIENFYSKNKTRYYYDEPHFKGAVVHCSSKKMAKVIKKYLKKYDFPQWKDALKKLTNSDNSQNVIIETGLFKKGDNKFVDNLVFGVDNDMTYSPALPVSVTLGKKLKKKPDCMDDVRQAVVADLLNDRLITQNHGLVEKYKVEIDDNVLKTVNNSGSN